jgi:hypothetical protein
MWFVLQARELLLGPAPERRVNGLPRGAQIFRDRLGHPSIGMQPKPGFISISYVLILLA